MNTTSHSSGRGLVLTALATAALTLFHGGVAALGLGRLTVQSTLGEALRAEIDITSISPEEAASLQANLATAEAYRAAGVELNPALAGARVSLATRSDGRRVIRIQGDRSVGEPFVDLLLDVRWTGGRLQRAYTLLIDPPARTEASPPPAAEGGAAPSFAPAPVPAAPPAVPLPPPTPRAIEPSRPPAPPPSPAAPPPARPAPPPVSAPAPAPTPAPASASQADGGAYRVQRGDTLSAIARREAPAGVSLDQMLVSLYRGNPQAFVGDNMNRLKSGVVLNVPEAADQAKGISNEEARRVIQAHSADFANFRRQLAGAAPTVPSAEPPRQAQGKVEAAVEDRKTNAAPPPADKLTLTRGASVPEAALSKDAERKAADARVAELKRNVEDLKKLSAAASSPTPTAASGVGRAASLPGVDLPVASPLPAAASAASAAASIPASASAPQAASAASGAASAPKKPAPPPVEAEEPGFLESLMSSSYLLPGAVGLVALLAGLGLMRLRRRGQGGSGETSFLESKLQPDSFFGVSGGQRVDTRDGDGGSTNSSSLSYSLSQLDAIGDVDPVAEADVYLAYGRDLQAEEILKEALRTAPERAAIRAKLLEVYAKRLDLVNFEAQAKALQPLVDGDSDEWLKAQALGRQIDPGNPLYGVEEAGAVDIDTSSEPPPDLREPPPAAEPFPEIDKTQPLDEPAGRVEDDNSLDLDIDLESPPALTGLEPTMPAGAEMLGGSLADEPPAARLEDEFPPVDLPPRQDPPDSAPVDLDFGDLQLEPAEPATVSPSLAEDAPAPAAAGAAPQPPAVEPEAASADDEPLLRKLELAEEFRLIGDTEGARDLLEEVVAQASGPTKAKAQALLSQLG